MKKDSLVGKIKYIAYSMIIVQVFLIAILIVLQLDSKYVDNLRNYPDGLSIYIKDISKGKEKDSLNYILEESDEKDLFIVKEGSIRGDGLYKGVKLGVYGNVEKNHVDFYFLGENILNKDNLKKLLESKKDDMVLGIEDTSLKSLESIPHFNTHSNIAIKQLPKLIEETDNISGEYKIVGLNSETEKEEFLEGLSKISGIDKKNLLIKKSGMYLDGSLAKDTLLVLILFQAFCIIVSLVIIAIKSLDKLGKLTLIGWSRFSFSFKIFFRFIAFSLILFPIVIISGIFISGWGVFSPMLISYFSLGAFINTIIVLISIFVASTIVVMIKPIDAIRGRYNRKPIYVLGGLSYIILSIIMVVGSIYLDAAVKEVADNKRIIDEWKNVKDYYILSEYFTDEEKAYSGVALSELDKEIYNWYCEIVDYKGVYIVRADYYSKEILKELNSVGLYESKIPEDPHWKFTVSPSYLEKMNIDIEDKYIEDAKNGKRLYLLPKELSTEKRKQTISWIKNMDTESISKEDIPTKFNKSKEFEFIDYDGNKEVFTWARDEKENVKAKNPIIYVTTPQNMTFMESESLKTQGLDGYIKFENEDAKEKATSKNVLKRHNLLKNKFKFNTIYKYIDGLTKKTTVIIRWFSGLFFIGVLIVSVILVALVTIYKMTNQETINVKKFLGFSSWKIYKTPIILLSSVMILEFIAVIIARSKLGIFFISGSSIIQFAIFWKAVSYDEFKNILMYFKGE